MKLARALAMALVASVAFVACNEVSTGIEIADFAGFWTATEFSYDDQSGDFPGFGIDIVSPTVGGTVTLDITDSGVFTGTLRVPSLTVDPETGETISIPISGSISLVDDRTVRFDFDDATEQLGFFSDFETEFTLTDDLLTFEHQDTTFDYPDALEVNILGEARGPVPVDLTAEFSRA